MIELRPGERIANIHYLSVRLLLGKFSKEHNYLPDHLNKFLRKCFGDTATDTWPQDGLHDFEFVHDFYQTQAGRTTLDIRFHGDHDIKCLAD